MIKNLIKISMIFGMLIFLSSCTKLDSFIAEIEEDIFEEELLEVELNYNGHTYKFFGEYETPGWNFNKEKKEKVKAYYTDGSKPEVDIYTLKEDENNILLKEADNFFSEGLFYIRKDVEFPNYRNKDVEVNKITFNWDYYEENKQEDNINIIEKDDIDLVLEYIRNILIGNDKTYEKVYVKDSIKYNDENIALVEIYFKDFPASYIQGEIVKLDNGKYAYHIPYDIVLNYYYLPDKIINKYLNKNN